MKKTRGSIFIIQTVLKRAVITQNLAEKLKFLLISVEKLKFLLNMQSKLCNIDLNDGSRSQSISQVK